MLTPNSDLSESLVSACRAGIGDDLRSVVYFTPDDFEVLYTRADLYEDGDQERSAKATFVENERTGFGIEPLYADRLAGDTPAFGEYEVTVRVFEDGFVSRVIVGDHGVLTTTDGLDVDAFEEVAVTVRKLLADAA